MSRALVQAIHKISKKHAAEARTGHLGTVRSLDPLEVEVHGRADVVSEDEGLAMTQWVKFYDATTGIEVDDVVHLTYKHGHWSVVDVESEKDVVTP